MMGEGQDGDRRLDELLERVRETASAFYTAVAEQKKRRAESGDIPDGSADTAATREHQAIQEYERALKAASGFLSRKR